jgi:hypothetical protein
MRLEFLVIGDVVHVLAALASSSLAGSPEMRWAR